MRLLIVLEAVAYAAAGASFYAGAICLVGAIYPPTREIVSIRTFILLTTWGTAIVFAAALFPRIL